MKNTNTTHNTQQITSKPLVSIVMPVYNALPYLKDALESVLYQTYTNTEIIVVDDRSTDGSWELLRDYKKRYPSKIRLIRSAKNLNCGGDKCANTGLLKAKGEFIARMDADDIAAPNRIEKQVAFLLSNPKVTLVGTQAYVIDKNGIIIGEKNEPASFSAIKKAYFTYHPIIHPSVMLKRCIAGRAFQYEIEYSANNDYFNFFRLICQGYLLANLEEKLLYYRLHGDNDTFTNIKEKFLNTYKIRKQMIKEYRYRPSMNAYIVSEFQKLIILLFPEKLLGMLYLYSKGILSFKTAFSDTFSFYFSSFTQKIKQVAYFL